MKNLLNQFNNINFKEVYTWPFIVQITFLILAFSAIIIAGVFLLVNPQFEDLQKTEDEEIKLKEQFLDKKKQAVNLDLYKQQLVDVEKTFGQLLRQLPNKSEMDGLLSDINQAGLGRGLEIESFKPTVEKFKDFYAELPIDIKLTGSYQDLGIFTEDISKLTRIVVLSNLNIQQVKDKITMETTARTFRYLDQKELDEVARAKKAAEKKKATPAAAADKKAAG